MAQNAVFREQVRALIQEEGDGWEDQVLDTVTQLENELGAVRTRGTGGHADPPLVFRGYFFKQVAN